MKLKTILLIISTVALLGVQHAMAACAATGEPCTHDVECCSEACSPVFNYCLPQ
ncbi:conotoxin like protein [Lonomia obliqua multiple nucleopolyhedrovirus]|uniref:Conotoxin like protein n=1 Tax=Lonomia obliqua multiple nucleopolyhedrovirus TaxID=134394 RepID=A0A126FCD3_9ABAC|nr:conotoxin like protein [Lonomia obliqua multiple nucleopolyhedrovirus]AKN81061.1 conotoxin like protein [Lonomia obliqua multiple nucleopolyhedrovirus]